MASRHPDARAARQARYDEIVKAVAKELKVKPNSETAQHVSYYRFARELTHENMISRGDVDFAALAKIDEVLRQYIVKDMKVSVHIVDGKSDRETMCPCGCGHRFNPNSDEAQNALRNDFDQQQKAGGSGKQIVSRGKTISKTLPKPSLAAVCAASPIAQMGVQVHKEAAAALGVPLPEPIVTARPTSPLSLETPSPDGRSINSAVITVPDGKGGAHTLRSPLKRWQDQSGRNPDPADRGDDPRTSALKTFNDKHPLPTPIIP
jgi:hypothetical protein